MTTIGTIPFPVNLSNVDGFFRSDNTFTARGNGLYFVYFSVGVDSGMNTTVRTRGGYPPLTYQWLSTSHEAVRTGSRAGLMKITKGVTARLSYSNG